MELMEIIKSSVSIFTMMMFGLVILSYVIYKFKDQTRPKPYERVLEIQKTEAMAMPKEYMMINQMSNDKILQEKYKQEQLFRQEHLRVEQQRQEQMKINQMNWDIQNRNYKNQDMQRRSQLPENKFRVVNPIIRTEPAYMSKNIFELYSQNEKEQMHKLKLAAN